jgi:hypothetical protein
MTDRIITRFMLAEQLRMAVSAIRAETVWGRP